MCGTNTTTTNLSASRRLFSTAAALTVAFAGLYGAPASAQGIVLDEVIVTAQKREQSLEDVPASVSAISGETVRDLLGSAENIRALANRVPSLNIESSNGRTQPRFYLRGLGNIDFDNNAAQPVGMVFDDVFLESNVLRSLPLYDIERVEVLKGPQGSLFGRNTLLLREEGGRLRLRTSRGAAYVPSPVLCGGFLLVVSNRFVRWT